MSEFIDIIIPVVGICAGVLGWYLGYKKDTSKAILDRPLSDLKLLNDTLVGIDLNRVDRISLKVINSYYHTLDNILSSDGVYLAFRDYEVNAIRNVGTEFHNKVKQILNS